MGKQQKKKPDVVVAVREVAAAVFGLGLAPPGEPRITLTADAQRHLDACLAALGDDTD